jgi:hypothetical protein
MSRPIFVGMGGDRLSATESHCVDTGVVCLRTESMGSPRTILRAIGSESANLGDFGASLHGASVTCLVDVRGLTLSRHRGFSKSALSAALQADGIDYVHLRGGLSDPKEGEGSRPPGDHARFVSVFTRHMKTPVAQTDLVGAASLVAGVAPA